MSLFLIAIAAVLLLGALAEVAFQRTGVPRALWLIVSGLLLGPILGLVPRQGMAELAPYVALPALVLVLTETGSQLRVGVVIRSLPRVGLLAAASFGVTVVAVTIAALVAKLLGILPDAWGLSQSLLLGLILGASCAAITTPAMLRSGLAPTTTQSFEIECSLTSATSIAAVAVLMAALDPHAVGFVDTLTHMLATVALGVAMGLVGAALWFGFLYLLQAPSYAHMAIVAAMMVLFVATERLGGSGLLAVLTSTTVLANAPDIAARLHLRRTVEVDKDARGYRRLLLFVVRSSFFLFVGILLGPPWGLLVLGIVLGSLLLPARLPAAFASTKWSAWNPNARALAAVAVPRGILAGALALLPMQAGVPAAAAFPIATFAVIFVTTATFAMAFPIARRRLPTQDIVELDVAGEISASPVSIVTPDEASRRALMPSWTDEVPASRPAASRAAEGQKPVGPLPPPVPPPARKHEG